MDAQKQAQQQQELQTKLWAIANDLRGTMETYEFKNYILGVIFYRYLSEKQQNHFKEALENDGITFEEALKNKEYHDELVEDALDNLGYMIQPGEFFSDMAEAVRNDEFDIENFGKAINSIIDSTIGTESQQDFEGLFDDMDITDKKLGTSVSDRSKNMGKIISSIANIDFHLDDAEIDVLGDTYEYLIGQFAANAGKKAGEFYTPQMASELLVRLATVGIDKARNVCDPTCGSGSLLLRVADHVKVHKYYGQEKTAATYNLARMNMILHDVDYDRFTIYNGDTLEKDNFDGLEFDIQVANPPYSAKWSADSKFLDDERFEGYGKLAPKSKADFAFVQHMIHHMSDDGRIAVLLPHGVLFRGAAEGMIRERIVKDLNYLDAVIGLPANLFYGTSIPVCVLVLKKERNGNADNILFIDASKEFKAGKNQNSLTKENIDKIVETYENRVDVDKYAHVATMQEISDNDYNLNIPRYVDTSEPEVEIKLDDVFAELKNIDDEIQEATKELAGYFDELGIKDWTL